MWQKGGKITSLSLHISPPRPRHLLLYTWAKSYILDGLFKCLTVNLLYNVYFDIYLNVVCQLMPSIPLICSINNYVPLVAYGNNGLINMLEIQELSYR